MVGDCDLQQGVAGSYCQSIGSVMPPSHLCEIEGCRSGELEELMSIEDEEVTKVADDQCVGFGSVER